MLSLYRRHRPRTFDEVVGQEHVVRTLRNAIELGKVHHAYLFVGSRGTGKTSMAKLLACALNARGGPSADFAPDDPACEAIVKGTSLDVVEMDAASNNSVDDIRELRENVALAPMEGGSRVYILDEAHMLTPAAWNAFLKTLEEPPPHVVFVLATTEAHKVPATIIDRCHRFDFHRPTLEQIAGVVRRAAEGEGIEIPEPAVGMLARAATGSFRDALGTLEQLVTFGGKAVQLDDVLEVLGVAPAELVLDAAEAVVARDSKQALLAVQRLSESGRDYAQFMRDLSAHLRHLLVVKATGTVPDSFSVTAEHPEKLASQAERVGEGALVQSIEYLAQATSAVKEGSDPRVQLEVALLKSTQPQADVSMKALMLRVEQLERRLAAAEAGGAPAQAPGAAPSDGSGSASPSPPDRPVAARRTEAHAGGPAPAVSAGAATAAAVADPVEEPEPVATTAPEVNLENIQALWSGVADSVTQENAMVGALLSEARPSAVEADRLTLAFPEDAAFSKKKAEANRELVERVLRGLTGRPLAVRYELTTTPTENAPSVLSEDELLARLREEFGAEEVFEDDEPESED